MKTYGFDTERLHLTTSDMSMVGEMLDFNKRNKEHFSLWEDKKPWDYFTRDYYKFLVRSEQEQRKNGTGLDFWIYHSIDDKLIGKITVFGIIGGNASLCMIGYKLDKAYQHKGYMHEALGELVKILFEHFEMHRIEIYILPKNVPSRRLVEGLGFFEEGISRSFMRINGVWQDHVRYVKINENMK